jgi:hypothetical protein
VFKRILEEAAKLKTGEMRLSEFLALDPTDRAGVAGCVAGELAGRDPAAAFELLSAAIILQGQRESGGEA